MLIAHGRKRLHLMMALRARTTELNCMNSSAIIWLRSTRARRRAAEQHRICGAAVLMTAGQVAFASLRVQSVARHHNRYLPLRPVRIVSLRPPQIAVHPTVTDGESGCQHIDDLPLGQLSLRIG